MTHAPAPRPDITPERLFPGDSDVARLMRQKDWRATSLGPIDGWSTSLKTLVRMLLSSRYQMWMGWGPDLTFFYNDAYRPTLGAKHPNALAMPTREVWGEIWDALQSRFRRVLEDGEATWDEALLLLLERNGYPEETYHTFSYSPISDDDGGIAGLICVVTEETERVINERRLALVRELSSRLASTNATPEVLDALTAVLPLDTRDLPFTLTYLLDDQGQTATLAATSGIPDGHPAAPATIVLGEEGPWPLPSSAAALRPTQLALRTDVDWPAGPWARVPSAAIVLPIARQGQVSPAGVFIAGLNPHRPLDEAYRSFLDLFARQLAAGLANARAYEQERQRAEALAEIDRAKTAFFSNVSHEFRTPLTLMLGPLEELRTTAREPEIREQAMLMHRNALRLLRLVNTLLDFSRIESGRAQATYQPTDLSRFTADLVSLFRSATDRAGLRLVVDTPPLPEPAYVDRDMWEKIVLNLVSNAFKYTLHGDITVTLRSLDGHVELRVQDTGIGIDAAEIPRLFERFHRVDGARGRTHEGTGIGLALVQELVTLHGGSVTVDSELNRGTVFAVRIPLGAAHLPPERVHDSPTAERISGGQAFVEEALQWLPYDAGTSGSLPLVTDTRTERILLADDNADMRDYVSRLLETRWDVEAVANGRAALDAIVRDRPDLIVTDVMMPEVDGFGLLESVRSDPRTRDVPVIMLSARAGEEAALDGVRAGADDYVVKPFSARDLMARVEALLVRRRIRAVEEAHARRQAAVFEQAPVAIALLRGPEHIFESANPLYRSLVGDRDIAGKPIREALPELAGQGIFELLDQVRDSRTPYVGRGLHLFMQRRDGDGLEDRYFDFVYQPVLDSAGHTDAIAVVCYDVTEATLARRDAEVANRAKDEFLAMLGHELRNPLAPILTALHLLRLKGPETGERERAIIERQVKHLVALVDDLLDVSRITRGKIQIRHVRVPVAKAIAKAIETSSPLLEQKAHDLQLELESDTLAVNGDPDRLAQIVSNLLTNAAKYTEDGGRITVSARREQDQVVLSVRDTGIGIAPDMLPRIFELFVQERQALDRAQGGLGLGLSIVRSLVQLHGGRIDARSDGAGTGAEFIVRLPAADATDPAESVESPATPSAPSTRGSTATRVLIVDDNRDAATLLGDALTITGYQVQIAVDGPSALRLAESFTPQVALLDIGLPVMDGYELARRFREHPHLRSVRLLALTGYGQARDRERALQAGFEAHLVKPLDLDALQRVLKQPPG